MRSGARPALPLLALLLLPLFAAAAGAQEAPDVEASATPPLPIRPGGTGDSTLTLRYCYSSSAAARVPSTIDVRAEQSAAWLSATPEPSTFQAVASGTCGNRDVALRLATTRDAPAYEPAYVKLDITSKGAGGGSKTVSTQVPVQAEYWAELTAQKPDAPRIARGDSGQLKLLVTVGANDGTRLEITGFDARGQVNVAGKLQDSGAGGGLDRRDSQTIPLTLTVSPGAPLGITHLTLNISTMAARRPGLHGEAKQIEADVDVTAAGTNPVPGPEVGVVLVAAATLAVAARRARRA